MVLQDFDNTPPPDGFGDNPSQDDNLPPGRLFDPSQLPQPIPILAPLLGISETATRYKTEQTIRYAEKRVQRPLVSAEIQALATHCYQIEQTKSYFAAAGAAAGAWRWYNTMATYKFPFFAPKPDTVDPNKFLFVRGPYAQSARHSSRLAMYLLVATQGAKFIAQFVAQPVAAKATSEDPALAGFVRDLKSIMVNDQNRGRDPRENRQAEWENQRQGREAKLPPHAGAPQPWGRRPAQKEEPNPSRSWDADDDMSPTAGNGDGWSSSTADSLGESGYSSTGAQGASQNAPYPTRREAQNAWDRQPSRPTGGDADDASPTGGLFQNETQNQAQNQSRPGESAWERLRRGAGPAPGQNPQSRRPEWPHREQREGSTLGDSFTFAETDDERRLAQERAQREFDERIERERQGKDFNEGNEKRW